MNQIINWELLEMEARAKFDDLPKEPDEEPNYFSYLQIDPDEYYDQDR